MTNARETLPPNRPGSADPDPVGDTDLEHDTSNRPLPMTGEEPDVGLSQKGTDEDAVIRRETEI
ncbi:hypothetical protein SAMN05216360_12416 [Methylobacterium phyllostachyos]|uniref:Uncharacterized protein n=1 Tax=Methylobacterium phyllostachyos TaxID=582672 RepID=A0A1H0JXY3_9HYPH|nr:hypothetical protein [Methylobacterium phyllostachyos]SDO48615.1 hypothetical protein SAMN05216360_12416 [Methylobacterium phyllostachyos]